MDEENKTKQKNTAHCLRIVLIVICIGVFLFSGYKIGTHYLSGKQSETFNESLAEEVFEPNGTASENETGGTEKTTTKKQVKKVPDFTVNFTKLQKKNKDVCAWLWCGGTVINYPVVKSKDNKDYLYQLLDGTSNKSGTLFIDCCNSADFTDENTVIYGHNMKNGSMFGTFTRYKNQSYYDENPVMYLFTPDGEYKIELFAGYVTGDESAIYDVPMTVKEKNKIVEKAKKNSTFSSKTEVGEDDKIITLSTCSYDFEGARYVLLGKLLKVS